MRSLYHFKTHKKNCVAFELKNRYITLELESKKNLFNSSFYFLTRKRSIQIEFFFKKISSSIIPDRIKSAFSKFGKKKKIEPRFLNKKPQRYRFYKISLFMSSFLNHHRHHHHHSCSEDGSGCFFFIDTNKYLPKLYRTGFSFCTLKCTNALKNSD